MCDYCSWINKFIDRLDAETQAKKKRLTILASPVIIVHGGAGYIPQYAQKFMLNEVRKIAITMYRELMKECSSVDVVERAICHMERKKYFNCAFGGSMDANGEVVMDAAIMTDNFRAGCVGAVRNIAHPITLAKKVLEETKHVLIVEAGAQKFAENLNIPILPPGKLIVTSDSQTSLQEEIEEPKDLDIDQPVQIEKDDQCNIEICIPGCMDEKVEKKDEVKDVPSEIVDIDELLDIESNFIQVSGAVGAVAYDQNRRLASGTSAAGQSGKLYGSVTATGTAIGSGIYVDQDFCVSASGCDEIIHKHALAWRVSRRLRNKCISTTNEDATATMLKKLEEKTGESNMGVIVITGKGEPLVSFRCEHFPWACCDRGYIHYGCTRDEKFSERIDKEPLDCTCENIN